MSSGLSGMWPLSAEAKPCNAPAAFWPARSASPDAAAEAAARASSTESPLSGGLEKERFAAGLWFDFFCGFRSGATCESTVPQLSRFMALYSSVSEPRSFTIATGTHSCTQATGQSCSHQGDMRRHAQNRLTMHTCHRMRCMGYGSALVSTTVG